MRIHIVSRTSVLTLKYKKIGIPRAFFFHSFPGLFKVFFETLGMEPVISSPTTKQTLERATHVCEAEHCLPNKLFDGHVMSLKDRVDAMFIPRIISMTRGYIACPRFGALPEATRSWLGDTVPIISFDINQTKVPLHRSLEKFGKELTGSKKISRNAAQKSITSMERSLAEIRLKNKSYSSRKSKAEPAFLIFGHPYTLHDHFIADPILYKLEKLQVPVEVMSFDDPLGKPAGTPMDLLWCTFAKMYNRLQTLDKERYAGVIQISTFNCGCDSMMMERFSRRCKKHGVPYMIMMVDEHTGKAGVDTRLEAFIDSISWKRDAMTNQEPGQTSAKDCA